MVHLGLPTHVYNYLGEYIMHLRVKVAGYRVGIHDQPNSLVFLNYSGRPMKSCDMASALSYEMTSTGTKFRTPNTRFRSSVTTFVSRKL
jgi:hypothetical protein